jgi:hypothetical protein
MSQIDDFSSGAFRFLLNFFKNLCVFFSKNLSKNHKKSEKFGHTGERVPKAPGGQEGASGHLPVVWSILGPVVKTGWAGQPPVFANTGYERGEEKRKNGNLVFKTGWKFDLFSSPLSTRALDFSCFGTAEAVFLGSIVEFQSFSCSGDDTAVFTARWPPHGCPDVVVF